MTPHHYILQGLAHAAGVVVYIAAVAWFLFNIEDIADSFPAGFLAPVFMLLLFVISAAVTGLLVLGKPAHLYLSGKKKEAIALLASVLAWLIVFFAVLVLILVFVPQPGPPQVIPL